MSTTINDSMDNVKDIMNSAKEGTEHAAQSTRTVVLDGVRAVASVVSILRSFGVGDALGWFGLSRRRDRMGSSLAMFGAGVALGAGVGMLFAPMSGADTRRAILKGMKSLVGDAGRTVDKVEETVQKAEAGAEKAGKQAIGKVGDLATKAKTAVARVEHDVGEALTERAEAAREPAHAMGAAAKDAGRAPTPVDPGNHHATPPVR